jgi:hypothetical protein
LNQRIDGGGEGVTARLKVWLAGGLWRSALAKACLLLPFLCLFVGSAWLRAGAVAQKRTVDFDEAISLMAGAGRLDEYKAVTGRAAGKWVDASDLLVLNTVDDGGFSAVRESLLAADIHPPFFFWLVNAAARVDGGRVAVGHGVLVNALVHLCGVVLLYLLALRLFKRHAVAALTVALWTFSSSTLTTTAIVRQYEVLMVTAIAATLCLVGAVTSRRIVPWCVCLCVALWMALSTQLQSVALLVYTAVMVTIVSISAFRASDRVEAMRARVLGTVAAASSACVLAYFTYPKAIHEVLRRLGRISKEKAHQDGTEVLKLLEPLGDFLGQADRASQVAAVALFVSSIVLALYHGVRLLRRSPREARERDLLALFAPIGFLVVILLVARQQAMFSGGRGLATRYWAITFPFCALVVAQSFVTLAVLVKSFSRRITEGAAGGDPVKAGNRRAMASALLHVALAGLIGAVAVTRPPARALTKGSPDFASIVPLYGRVVIDNTKRGSFGQVLPFLDPESRVFLTDGAPRGEARTRLRAELRKPRSVLIVDLPGRGTSEKDRRRLLREVERAGFKVGPATHAEAFRALKKKSVVFFARSSSGAEASKAARGMVERLGASPSAIPGAFVGVMDSGRWLAESTGTRVGLSSRRLKVKGVGDTFVARARSEGTDRFAMVRVGSRTVRLDSPGVVAAVWERSRDRLRFIDAVGVGKLTGMYAARK